MILLPWLDETIHVIAVGNNLIIGILSIDCVNSLPIFEIW